VARRIRGGARADLAVLSASAMDALAGEGFLEAGTVRPLFVSDVVAAVPAVTAEVPLSTEADLRAALLDAGRIAYSTGPSGDALLALIARWDLTDALGGRLVQARPGVPVGSLLADDEADLGFQQRSELWALAGVRVLGPLPGDAAIRSTFSGAVLNRATDVEAAREVVEFLGSMDAEDVVRGAGMEPAQPH
jgi:molybdate transport system substrate-binding protein